MELFKNPNKLNLDSDCNSNDYGFRSWIFRKNKSYERGENETAKKVQIKM